MKIYKDLIQGTDEWHELRKLKLTASNATAIGNNGAGLKTYVTKLILRTFITEPEIFSKDIERGNILEPIARTKYEFEKGVPVYEVGFIEHCPNSGYSPDGLVDVDYKNEGPGLMEIKARNDAKHFALLQGGSVESGVQWQMQMGMMVTGRKWCDFVSYNPNFKKNSLFVKRFYIDDTKQQKLKLGLANGIKMLREQMKTPIVISELAA